MFQRGSPATTPTKYRPDGGDRYIPIRQTEEEWSNKYCSISAAPLLPDNGGSPGGRRSSARRLFHESTNNNNNGQQQPHATASSSPSSSSAPTGSRAAVAAASGHHQSSSVGNAGDQDTNGHDWLTHRALLRNELLKHSIIDVRVCEISGKALEVRNFKSSFGIFKT